MKNNFFGILKVTEERSRIQSWIRNPNSEVRVPRIRIRTKMSRIPNTAYLHNWYYSISPLTQDGEPRLVESLQEVRLPEDLPGLFQRQSAQALHVVPVQDSRRPLGGGEARLSVHQQGHTGRQPLLASCVLSASGRNYHFKKQGII